MNKNSKIYVAGHTGLVGSAIMRKLEKEGFTNLVLKTRKELNLLDANAVSDFFAKEKPEFVVDSAARVGGIKANIENQADFLFENLQIQNNLIWGAHKAGVKKFLFLGSSCIYPRDCPQPMKEEYFMTGKFEPTNEGYAVAKTAGIKLCEYIYNQYGQKFISCMPSNVYGPNDHFDPEYSHVHAGLMRRIHEAKVAGAVEVVVWGSGVSRREFLHVDDLAEAVLFLLQNYENKKFLNVGTGNDVSIKELAEMLVRIVEFKGKLAFDKTKPDGMPKKLMDSSKINKLGWKSKIKLEEGLKDLYKWFLENVADTKSHLQ